MRAVSASSLVLQLLLSTAPFLTAAYEWPAGIDPSVKYWPPGTGPPSKRWLVEFAEAYDANRSAIEGTPSQPTCVKKMSHEDPSEKFLPEYWNWAASGGSDRGQQAMGFRSPARRNVLDNYALGLFKRQNYQCAVGTYACTSIGKPQSCCNNNEQCVKIPDEGFGDVGCCTNGRTCTGNLSGCGEGKKACSSREGGGCCTEGYNCSPQGCVPAQGVTILTSTPTPTTRAAATTCSPGFYACPTNVAGGCCPSGRLCGITDCPSATTTGGAVITTGDTCPTGYYTCSAQYNGGCCRIGRDCGITDCPERAITISSGTARVGLGTTTAASCAEGWFTCARNLGGGCCPIGYQCAADNCPAVAITTNIVVSGSIVTSAIVSPAVSKLPMFTSSNAARLGASTNGIREVIVVVGVVIGVAAGV